MTTTTLLRHTVLAAALAGVALVAGCRSGPKTSGFLGDYTELEPHPKDARALVYFDRDVDMLEYDRVILDPVEVSLIEGSSLAADPDAARATADWFRGILAETIDPYYAIVDEAGPGVMRIKLSLSDVAPTDASAVGTVTPVPARSVAIEADLLDATSGRRIAAAVRRRGAADLIGELANEVAEEHRAYYAFAEAFLDFMNSDRTEMVR